MEKPRGQPEATPGNLTMETRSHYTEPCHTYHGDLTKKRLKKGVRNRSDGVKAAPEKREVVNKAVAVAGVTGGGCRVRWEGAELTAFACAATPFTSSTPGSNPGTTGSSSSLSAVHLFQPTLANHLSTLHSILIPASLKERPQYMPGFNSLIFMALNIKEDSSLDIPARDNRATRASTTLCQSVTPPFLPHCTSLSSSL
ncbi:hypothetical protein E2C01_019396 [Portunus trituberculatus]|uniref:Uncharacterized protein n=1 Tax=Portunus trituberculatus TaxID=210409 RepID=A0A5B7DXH1_PORTR|nr:hypothetical protein [Portunus trituberculatus]